VTTDAVAARAGEKPRRRRGAVGAALLALVWGAGAARSDEYPRQAALDVLHYDLQVELLDATGAISGAAEIQARVLGGTAGMTLDLEGMQVDRLAVGGVERTFTHRDGRLAFQFDRAYAPGEIARIVVRYHGVPRDHGMLTGSNGYGRRVWFAENWPDRAHHWFPSVDHPYDKATIELRVTAPERYDVVGIGRLVESRSLLDGRRITRWLESVPVPTYTMVLGAAEFSIRHLESAGGGVPLTVYAYPQDVEAAARRFARAALAVRYFTELIGPFPYEKLAQVESTTRIGGMENASAIFYAEAGFRQNQVRESPMAHEIAHQWFGDSVTPADWDHLWLSEGFATYFDGLFYEHLGGPDALKGLMETAAERVRKYHETRPAPIVDPGLKEITKKLNPLNYEKGAWTLHMLRHVLGDAVFFQGIREYYRLHAGRTATSEDFQRAMESASGRPLERFFRQWLHRPGWPEYAVTWSWNTSAGQVELEFEQRQASEPYAMPVDLTFHAGEGSVGYTVEIAERRQTVRVALPAAPDRVELDPGGWLLKTATVTARQPNPR
jgi:aminopeptidase N